MPVSFRILKSLGLVYTRYKGFTRMSDCGEMFQSYTRHRDFELGQKQLIDLSGMTGWDKDYVQMMQIQAQKTDVFMDSRAQILIVFYAPSDLSRHAAQLGMHTWDACQSVVPIVQETQANALAILGLPYPNFDDMLAQTA